MCKRRQSHRDPLVDLFLRKYKVNLLPLPIETAQCGQLYVQRPAATLGAVPGSIAELVTPAVTLPEPSIGEQLADVAGERSSGVPVKLGLKLLGNFLTALGVPPRLIDNVHAGYEHSVSHTLHFAFRDATRDAMDPFSIGTALIDHRFNAGHPWVGPGNRYFISAGVIRSGSISIDAEDERSDQVDLGLEALKLAGLDASISVQRHESGTMTYGGDKRLAIGVELYDLRFDDAAGKFTMGDGNVAVDLRRGVEVELVPAFPAGDDEALLEVETLA